MNRYSAIVLLVVLAVTSPLSAATVAYLDIGQRREYALDNIMDPGQVLRGHVSVKDAIGNHSVVLLWRDAFGRVAGADTVRTGPPLFAAELLIN